MNIWQISTKALDVKYDEAVAKAEGLGSASMYSELIDPAVMEDLIDYFYYAQLRTQGEDTMEERKITGLVPLKELPNLVRALGFYPSEEECATMIAEVYYANFTETGETCETINLDTFIKLYINHRPVFGTSKAEIAKAFESLNKGSNMSWAKLVGVLKEKGEVIKEDDLKNIMKALLGKGAENEINPTENMTAEKFSDKVLGFDEDVEEDVGDGGFDETGVTGLSLAV